VRRRSSWSIALGLSALVASWAFGSTPLTVVGLGFVLAGALARAWARAVRGSLEVERRLLPGDRIVGGDVAIEVSVRHRRRALGGSITVRQPLGAAVRESRVPGARSVVVFPAVPRGRHRLGPLDTAIVDPLGLERVEHRLDEETDVLVRPRIPVLTTVFSAHGLREAGSARSAFRRPTGFEIHAIRDYAPGEPLRAVHWPSTARRGQLMVKELDDAPREDVAVILDQDPEAVAGPPGASSFDAAVRAAGAVALAHLLAGRRVVVVGTSPMAHPARARSTGHDWEGVLDVLAAVEPVVGARIDRALRTPATAVAQARELVVVTARPELAANALLALRRGGRSVSLVVVASETFAGRPRNGASTAALRAAGSGVPVALVSAGVPLEHALAGRSLRVVPSQSPVAGAVSG
jgi:uncharacterized protein (DUF58 family)